ncbi:MAG: nucleotidyltransferase domain-containing protein [Flavobacteriales bacterium]|nr:nucleotidyltransferase domain-containing protein [Flavobacteriales bacterium]
MEEVCTYSKSKITEGEIQELIQLGAIRKIDDKFYCLSDSKADLDDRLKGNNRARKLVKKATKKANFIGRFPFVKSVCISGSMSKGYMDREADIDFFIITKPQRLWLARTMLILYK